MIRNVTKMGKIDQIQYNYIVTHFAGVNKMLINPDVISDFV